MQTDSETHVLQCSREGRAFVPGSQFVLVLPCFTVQTYISKQHMSSCFQNGLQDAVSFTCKHTHRHTYILARMCLMMLIHSVHENKSSTPQLFMQPHNSISVCAIARRPQRILALGDCSAWMRAADGDPRRGREERQKWESK